jgi:predicted Fe-S protein YdhL (DUF1289 family)
VDDPASPCNGVCRLDRRLRWCIGCGRTASEIGRWPAADSAEKSAILAKLPSRLRRMDSKRDKR